MINHQIEIDALRSEVKHGFAYVNARLDSVDLQLARNNRQVEELRAEMRAQGEELRAEMRAQGESLESKIYKIVNEAVDSIMDGMNRCFEHLSLRLDNVEQRVERLEKKNSD
ncbi:MAG: hypothetical protein K2X27_27505 [Candidatus Obscuribacterales bacterium]|nr:hypothetical protein [Candidatus Obscuribacterales bacterium]